MIRSLLAASAVFATTGAAAAQFDFVALGNMPYGDPAEVYAPFETLIDTVNGLEPRLVVHVGDTKAGGTECSDAILDDQRAYLDAFTAPTLYTPGDNEWTDCHREAAGGYDPLERLAYIRTQYFAEPATSIGAETLELEHQGDRGYPENARARVDDVLFVTAHVVGSDNNFETRSLAAVGKFMARDVATAEWLTESFEGASDVAAAVVSIHANMLADTFDAQDESWSRHSGFGRFGPTLQEAAAAFGKPVLLIYGDSHVLDVRRPFPASAPNVTALQVFGAADMHAIEISVDTWTPGVFGFRPVLNPGLTD